VELIAAIDYDESELSSAVTHQARPPVTPEPRFVEPAHSHRAHQASNVDRAVWAEQTPKHRESGNNVASFGDAYSKAGQRVAAQPNVAREADPALQAMRDELDAMRGMLETRLANLAQRSAPVAASSNNASVAELQSRISRLGIGAHLGRALIHNLPMEYDVDELWRRILGKVAAQLPIAEDSILTHGGVVALIGPTGVGKTTTVAKLAARYALRHGSRDVALISTDNFRIGAHDQIKAYARILGVPYRFASNAESLQAALDQFCDRRLVLIDTAGMSQKDLRLSQQLAVLKTTSQIKNYLVMSATSRLSGLDEIVRAFGNVELAGTILTKIDESVTLGQALDVLIRHRLPLAYVSDGQRVPEDLQPARAHTIVSRSVSVMQENEALLENEWVGIGVGEALS